MRTTVEIVEILENYLKEKKLSLRQFSALVDIPHSTILTWKKKNTLPSIESTSKIASFMNVSLDWLVNGENFEYSDIYEKGYKDGFNRCKKEIEKLISRIG